MARNLIKYQNMEEFVEAQENDQVVESIVPGVAYVKEGPQPGPEIIDIDDQLTFGTGMPAPDGSATFYNDIPQPDPRFDDKS
jgi:hypothetical protein